MAQELPAIDPRNGLPLYSCSNPQCVAKRELDHLRSILYDGIWEFWADHNFEFYSDTFWQMLGYEREEKSNSPQEWQSMLDPQVLEDVMNLLQNCIETQGGTDFVCKVCYPHKDGSHRWVLCRGKVVYWSDTGTPLRMIGTHTDITELQSLYESEMKAKLEQTRQMHQQRSHFAYLSHELRTPLSSILGYVELLRHDMANSSSGTTPARERERDDESRYKT